jgi:hypothetical protein
MVVFSFPTVWYGMYETFTTGFLADLSTKIWDQVALRGGSRCSSVVARNQFNMALFRRHHRSIAIYIHDICTRMYALCSLSGFNNGYQMKAMLRLELLVTSCAPSGDFAQVSLQNGGRRKRVVVAELNST